MADLILPSQDEESGPPPERPFSSLRGSLRTAKDRIAEPHKFHRASSSLRRVLTDSSKRNKRPSIFGAMHKKSSSPKGPEEYQSDDGGSCPATPEHGLGRFTASFRSRDTRRQSTSVNTADRGVFGEDQSPKHSSPIPIPRHSSPPAISFEIESGALSPRTVFGQVEQEYIPDMSTDVPPNTAAASSTIKTLPRMLSRKRPKMHRKSSDSSDNTVSHVPKRASNDHWKLRRLSRKKSCQHDDRSVVPSSSLETATPMPGTNLPLEDPFDSLSARTLVTADATSGVDSPTAEVPTLDGAVDFTDCMAASFSVFSERQSTTLVSDGRVQGQVAKSGSDLTLLRDLEYVKEILLTVRQDAALATLREGGMLEPGRPEWHCTARSEAFALMNERLRTIETYVQKLSSDILDSRKCSLTGHADEQCQDRSCALKFDARNELIHAVEQQHDENLGDEYQSPLQTQDLFYPSDNECDYDSDGDSASSSARNYLNSMQSIASNGSPMRTGSPSSSKGNAAGRVLATLNERSDEFDHDGKDKPSEIEGDHEEEDSASPSVSMSDFDRYYFEFFANHVRGRELTDSTGTIVSDNDQYGTKDMYTSELAEAGPSTPAKESIRDTEKNERTSETDVSSSSLESRANSACIIPVCNVCGGPDDHLCDSRLRVMPTSAVAEAEEKVEATPETGKRLIGRELFDMIERSSPGIRSVRGVSYPRPVLSTPKESGSAISSRSRKHRADTTDPFSDDQYVRAAMEWETENPFEILSNVYRDRSPDPASKRKLAEKTTDKVSKAPSSRRRALRTISANHADGRENRRASFCSDTDIEQDLDGKDFTMGPRTWNTFQPWN